jgi:hypothetical protein
VQSGFNTNIRHRGVLFHVQTEDSGTSNPHVITHLFHGGNIMASQKRDYSEQVSEEGLENIVRRLMETQHKTMLKGLRASDHDDVILERLGPEVFAENSSEAAAPSTTAAILAPESQTQPDVSISAAAAPSSERSPLARAFGQDVVSSKPLDEVVLDYLVESARKRKHSAK